MFERLALGHRRGSREKRGGVGRLEVKLLRSRCGRRERIFGVLDHRAIIALIASAKSAGCALEFAASARAGVTGQRLAGCGAIAAAIACAEGWA